MIVRELITLLGIEVDDGDMRKVDTAVTRFEDRMRKVGQFIGGSVFIAGFARAAGAAVQFASDAEETLNVLRETFESNAAEVEAWSVRVAREVGRSEFLMREMAGTIGAVLTPMMAGNTQASAEMSTQLAQLAVDLASFFNSTESDALNALRSAITGEVEPMKRFGVVLTEANLQNFALEQGIRKQVKAMNQAEKTALRYQAIMHFTAKAQGDAARTGDGFANASRAAADGVKDLATRIGDRLLPFATRLLIWTRDTTRSFIEFTQHSHILEAGLITMGAAIAALAVVMVAPFLPFLLTGVKVAALVGAITLAVDDLITFFTGGQSVLGEFIDQLYGIGTAQQFVDNLKDGWDIMTESIDKAMLSVADWTLEMIDAFGEGKSAMAEFEENFDQVFGEGTLAKVKEWASNVVSSIFPIFGSMRQLAELIGLDAAAGQAEGALPRAVTRGIDSAVVTARKGSTGAGLRLGRARQLEAKRAAGKLTERERTELSSITDQTDGRAFETYNERRRREIQEKRDAHRRAIEERQAANDRGLGTAMDLARQRAQARQNAFTYDVAAAPARRSAPASVNVPIEAKITIHQASDPAAVEAAVRRGLSSAVEDAGAALSRGG